MKLNLLYSLFARGVGVGFKHPMIKMDHNDDLQEVALEVLIEVVLEVIL